MLDPKTTLTSHSLINGFDVPSSPCDLPRGKEHVTSLDPPQKTFGAHPKWAQNYAYAYIKPFSNNPPHKWNLTERKCNNMI